MLYAIELVLLQKVFWEQ